MASFSRQGRNTFKFSKQLFSSLKQPKCSMSLRSHVTAKSGLKSVVGNDAQLLFRASRKQLSKMEMRQLQKSVAVMSLTSKVSTCLNSITISDTDVSEACEDSDDVCSQPGHKLRKRRI